MLTVQAFRASLTEGRFTRPKWISASELDSTDENNRKGSLMLKKYVLKNRAFLLFIFFMFMFRSAVADWNEVPTGSMKPTIIEGDRILVNKAAYDIRIPFTHVSLHRVSDPATGDIVVFDSAAAGKRLVKRVVGVPGDVVELTDNILHINERPLEYAPHASSGVTVDLTEELLGIAHKIRVTKGGSRLSSFSPVEVPAGHYLVLGDNRDASADSRVIGFVPRKEIVGRTRSVVVSLNYDKFYLPRPDRVFRTIL